MTEPVQHENSVAIDRWALVYLVLGILLIGNALWMFVDPVHGDTELPTGALDSGSLNRHVVRDVACALLTLGTALIWGALDPRYRFPLVAMAAFFMSAHAVLHAFDTATGALPGNIAWLDVSTVYAPAGLLVYATTRLARAARSGAV